MPSFFRFLIFLVISISYLAVICRSFSPENPTGRQILVLLDDLAIKSSHSLYFKSLQSRGFQLDFKLADDPKIALQRYGQYLYDALIIFSPSVERFGGSISTAAIMDFVDSGHDLILAADESASDLIREVASECGVDFDEDPGPVGIDHTSYAVSDANGDQSIIAADDFIESDVILGSKIIEAPVLFQGIGHSVNAANNLVLKVLSASPAAYSANPNSKLSNPPSIYGSSISFVSVVQMENDTTSEELPVGLVHPNMLSELPDDIVIDILSRLPVKTLVQSTSVCKNWYSLIKTPSFITMHLCCSLSKLATHTSKAFVLLTSTDNEPNCSIFYDDENFTLHSRVKIPFQTESKSVRLVGSCHGLLCLTDANAAFGKTVYLYNPAVQKYRNLSHEFSSCYVNPVLGFGYNEEERDYMIVRILYSFKGDFQKLPPKAEIYSLREKKWRSVKVHIDCVALPSFGVCFDGCFYWLAFEKTRKQIKCLISFDLKDEVFCEVKIPEECCDKDYFKDNVPGTLTCWNGSVCLIVVRLPDVCRKSTECVFWQLKKDGDGKISWKKQLYVLPEDIPCVPLGFTWTEKLVVSAIDRAKRVSSISKTAILNLENMKLQNLAEDGPHTIASPFLESLVLFLE